MLPRCLFLFILSFNAIIYSCDAIGKADADVRSCILMEIEAPDLKNRTSTSNYRPTYKKCVFNKKILSEFDQEITQSQIADKPKAL